MVVRRLTEEGFTLKLTPWLVQDTAPHGVLDGGPHVLNSRQPLAGGCPQAVCEVFLPTRQLTSSARASEEREEVRTKWYSVFYNLLG
jgi:hypothetical protein